LSAENTNQIPFPELSEKVPRQIQRDFKPGLSGLPLRDTPAYRAGYNPDVCSTQELLAAVLQGPENIAGAYHLLENFRGLQDISHAAVRELTQIPGIGPAKAASIKAAIELARRISVPVDESPSIQSPEDAAALLIPRMGHLEKERLLVLPLNTRNRLIGEPIEVYSGSLNSNVVRVGEIFRPALRANSAAIIVAHNHPSGDVTPSPEDIAITRAFVEAGKMLDVELLDHIIIGPNTYMSLKEKGLGFG
jgi:DNA repair protein RadC